jgi:protease I
MIRVYSKLVSLVALSSTWAFAEVFSPVRPDQVPSGLTYRVDQPAIESPVEFEGKRVAVLASHGVEESEILYPFTYLVNRGAQVDVVVPDWTAEGVVASQFLKPTLFVKGSQTFRSAQAIEYDLVVLTGGAWNAQVVRSDAEAIKLVTAHYEAGRPLAAICAGTAVLINAGIAKGQRLTGSPVVAPDLVNAGATFIDEPVVYGENLVTSRSPNDLPEFVKGLKQLLLSR